MEDQGEEQVVLQKEQEDEQVVWEVEMEVSEGEQRDEKLVMEVKMGVSDGDEGDEQVVLGVEMEAEHQPAILPHPPFLSPLAQSPVPRPVAGPSRSSGRLVARLIRRRLVFSEAEPEALEGEPVAGPSSRR